jgi:hypothetical protein
MLHIWEYPDATGVTRRGVMRGCVDRGGTDVTYRFHRLDESGAPIRYDNGGRCVDLVSGPRTKGARRIGGMTVEAYGYQPGD